MLDLDALARCEARLSGRVAPAPVLRPAAPDLARPDPRAAALPEGVSEEAMRRCPHLAALAGRELEGVE